MPHPWEVGDDRQRWDGYLDFSRIDYEVGKPILRNLVDAKSYAELRQIEDDFVGVRGPTLRAAGIPASYDLDGLRAIHHHLFQDVYAWAGDVRTVDIVKGTPFASPADAEPMLGQVAEAVQMTDHLRQVPEARIPEALARIYNVVNTAHPFREGNGRTQREFVTALAAESGHGLDWTKVDGGINNYASEQARQGKPETLTRMFEIVTYKTAEHRGIRALDATRQRGAPQRPNNQKQGERAYEPRPYHRARANPPNRGQGYGR